MTGHESVPGYFPGVPVHPPSSQTAQCAIWENQTVRVTFGGGDSGMSGALWSHLMPRGRKDCGTESWTMSDGLSPDMASGGRQFMATRQASFMSSHGVPLSFSRDPAIADIAISEQCSVLSTSKLMGAAA